MSSSQQLGLGGSVESMSHQTRALDAMAPSFKITFKVEFSMPVLDRLCNLDVLMVAVQPTDIDARSRT